MTTDPTPQVLPRLLALAQRLYGETSGFLDQADDPQLWYNRGYANGMLAAITELGHAAALTGLLVRDPPDLIQGQEVMPWGQAYRHGWEMGEREAREVLPAAAVQG